MVIYEHSSIGIKTQTIEFSENVNPMPHQYAFYNETIGPSVIDSIVIGSTDPSASTSITPKGLEIAWDRGQLIKNVQFINFPDSRSHAIACPVIIGRCT
jgi:hypothetical protein